MGRWNRIAITAITLAGMAAALPAGAQSVRFTAVDLGALNRGGSAVGLGLNDAGQAVGNSGFAHGADTRAFVWAAGAPMRGLRLPEEYSSAVAINNAGVVLGIGSFNGQMRAFTDTAGKASLLPLLDGYLNSSAAAINSNGDVAGSMSGPAGETAVVWSGGKATRIEPLPGFESSTATAINDAGQVAGQARNGGESHAFLWSAAEGARDLGNLPGAFSAAVAGMNRSGWVVGNSTGETGMRAFLWTPDLSLTELGTLPGGDYSQANAVNDAGTIVGASGTVLGTRAFMWTQERGMEDLNPLLVSHTGIVVTAATAINNKGQILAVGAFSHGVDLQNKKVELDHEGHAGILHVFLLTPIAPASR